MNTPVIPVAPTAAPFPHRLDSVDLLRGLVMVAMALDHTRDYFHSSAIQGADPLDLARTTPALFFTRWITHFCAPVFSFLAGLGVFLAIMRGKTKRHLSWLLVTRGLWLIFLELTLLMWFGWAFEIDLHSYFLATLWSLGWSMIALAGLIHLPFWAILTFSLTMIAGHNALDGIRPESWNSWGWLWQVLHSGGPFATKSGFKFLALYPLIPWLGVMSAGYCCGALYRLDAAVRRRWLRRAGCVLIAAFVLLRAANVYGNLTPWTRQPSPVFTFLSFLDATKYPPSLSYLLMTLGPGLLLLAHFERGTPAWMASLLAYGRVPFFFYVAHIPLIHAAAFAMNVFRHGRGDFSLVGGNPPPDAGIGLGATCCVWIAFVVALYPACKWFSDLKRRRRDAWLGYL